MEKNASQASFIHKAEYQRGKKKSCESQPWKMVQALTEMDQLSFLQGHKVPLPMHAVKGNLANTVCKRKHQHIGGDHVLRGVCTLFPNFTCNGGFSKGHNDDAGHRQSMGQDGQMNGWMNQDKQMYGWMNELERMDGWKKTDEQMDDINGLMFGQMDGGQ